MYKFIRISDDIASVKAMFPTIEQEKFEELIHLDPTYKEGVNSVGTYGKWILNLYKKNKLKEEDFYKVTDYLKQFEEKKKALANKDINQYKSLPDLIDVLNNTATPEKTKSQVKREIKNTDITKDAKLEFQSESWKIYIPLTYEASCKLGANTEWCTASNSNAAYYKSYSNQGDLHILINNDGPKFQFHFETKQFMDASDRQINLKDFIKENEELRPWLMPKLGFTEETITVTIPVKDIVSELESKDFDNSRIVTIYNFDHFDWFYYDDYYGDIDNLEYELDDDNKKRLSELGLSLANIPDIDLCARYAEEAGAANACYDDLISAINSAVDDAYGKIDGENATFEISFDQFLSMVDDCEYEYGEDFNLNDKKDVICNYINLQFSFEEPYYGWQDFSKEEFNERLDEKLYEIETGSLEPEFEDDDEAEGTWREKVALKNAKKELEERQMSLNLDSATKTSLVKYLQEISKRREEDIYIEDIINEIRKRLNLIVKVDDIDGWNYDDTTKYYSKTYFLHYPDNGKEKHFVIKMLVPDNGDWVVDEVIAYTTD